MPEALKPTTAAPVPRATAHPLKALLLRVGTIGRIALSEVLTLHPTQNADTTRQALAEFPADVVVADVGSSDREARALLAYLRDPASTPNRGLPAIRLLAESSSERVRGLVKAGVDHVMIKPISVASPWTAIPIPAAERGN